MKQTFAHDIDEFLNTFPPGIRELCRDLSAIIHTHFPAVIEQLYTGWKLIGYKLPEGRRRIYFCFIYPLADRVYLGFEHGILLEDPLGVLEGKGSQVRQVCICNAEDINVDYLGVLLKQSAEIATLGKRERMQRMLARDGK